MGALTLRGARLVTPMLVVPVLCLTLAACARRSGESGHSGRHEPVAGAASHPQHADGVWGLDVVSRGSTVDLLVATAEAGVVRLLHQRSSDGGRSWSTPVPVSAGELAPAHGHRGADPQIAAAGDRLLVAWTARGESSWGTGPIGTAVSADGGRSWAPGATPSDDGSRDGHGFIDLAATADGVFQAVWLDGRDGDGQGLRFASSPDGRAWSPNVTIDRMKKILMIFGVPLALIAAPANAYDFSSFSESNRTTLAAAFSTYFKTCDKPTPSNAEGILDQLLKETDKNAVKDK